MKETKFKKSYEKHMCNKEENLNSNNNLFKNDVHYKMNRNLTFDSGFEEDNCKRNLIIRNIDLLNYIIIFIICINVYYLFIQINIIITPLRIINIFLLIFSFLFLKQNQLNVRNLGILRIFLEIDLIFNLLINYSKDNLDYCTIFIKFMNGTLLDFILIMPNNERRIFIILENIIINIKLYSEYGIIGVFINLFSFKTFVICILAIVSSVIYYLFAIKIRELWALYDSFKRSYFNLQSIYDDYPNPLLIVSRKQLNTLYSNQKGAEFINNIIKTNNFKKKNKKCDMINFKDLFDKKIPEKFLENEIEKCLLNNTIKYIDIPISLNNNNIDFKDIESKYFTNIFKGELCKLEWVRLYVSSCSWKGIDSIIIYVFQNNELNYNYLKDDYDNLIIDEFKVVIDNIDLLCEKLTNQVNERISDFSKTPFQTVDYSKSPFYKNKSNINSPYSKERNYPDKKTNNCLTQYANNNSINLKSNQIDKSLLFLLKNSLNYIYDMNLTLNVYNTLRMNKVYKNLTTLHFKNFVNYMIQYFYPVSKSKNFVITTELTAELDGEVSVIYEYYRVIIFNILMFIINNSRKNEQEKQILITLKHSKFIDAQSSYYRITFKVTNENPIINHLILTDIFNRLKSIEFKNVNINEYKLLDIGIITSFYIVNSIFNSDFTVTSSSDNNYTLSAFIYVTGKNENNSPSQTIGTPPNKLLYTVKMLKPPRSNLEEVYYNKLIQKMFKKEKNDVQPFQRSPTRTYTIKNGKKIRNRSIGDKPYDRGNNDAYDSEEDRNVKLEKDLESYREMLLKFIQHQVKSPGSTQLRNRRNEIIKAKSFYTPRKCISNNKDHVFLDKSVKWDDSMCRIKYSLIPRILIVEDSVIGRYSITTTLKHLNIQYKVDIAVNGIQAVEKFKLLLSQGYMFDFIFMDIYLPEMNGLEATKEIRNIEKNYGENIHTNIVAVTVEGKKTLENEIFDEYFEKPIKNSGKFLQYLQLSLSEKRNNIMHLIDTRE